MLIKSGLVTSASGSLGGLTAARNRGGQYLRARVVPVDPGTARQTTIRNAVRDLTSRWSDTLTAAQREAWATYGANVPITNRLGDQILLSGQQHYIRSNVPRLQVGLAAVDDGPTVFDLGSFTDPILSVVAPTMVSLVFTATDAWVDETGSAMLVYTGRPAAPTINFFKGPYRATTAAILGDDTTPPTSPANLTSDYSYTTGQRAFGQVRVTRADGRLSGVTRLLATVS